MATTKTKTNLSELAVPQSAELKTRYSLLAYSNFSVAPKPQSITSWEELTCVGFNPQTSVLEAVVRIKQVSGYSGPLCSAGSKEYVRFFMDWNNNGNFVNLGVTSFSVYDIPDNPPLPDHPLNFVVRMNIDTAKYQKLCATPVLPKVRAVLSWNVMPSLNPNDNPFYGNKLDAHVQLPVLKKKLALAGLPDTQFFNLEESKTVLDTGTFKTLFDSYTQAKVPVHRTVYKTMFPMSKGTAPKDILAAQKNTGIVSLNDAELKAALAAFQSKYDTTYEELTCIGLDMAADTLGGVVKIKKPIGYLGDLCHPGSNEYVAFWADWDNNGTFDEYLGTAAVRVHDINTIPADGLCYNVSLFSPAFIKRLKSCKIPNVVKLRGVLSWDVAPSTINPNETYLYGNILDVEILVRPGDAVVIGDKISPLIYDISGVVLADIDPVTSLAYPAANPMGNAGTNRPWGGVVTINGRIFSNLAKKTIKYRVEFSTDNANWSPVSFSESYYIHDNPNLISYYDTQNTVDGWYLYEEDFNAGLFVENDHLASWDTGNRNGLHYLRLVYIDPANPGVVVPTASVSVILDNKNFVVSATANAMVDMTADFDLVIDGGDCHLYGAGTNTINGHLRVKDEHFGGWYFDLQPLAHTGGLEPTPASRIYTSNLDQGDDNLAWSLDISTLPNCGYTLTLVGYERTIVNANHGFVRWVSKAVGFAKF